MLSFMWLKCITGVNELIVSSMNAVVIHAININMADNSAFAVNVPAV